MNHARFCHCPLFHYLKLMYIQILEKGNFFSKEIVTEIKLLEKFYYAEKYHQDYEKNNPNNPYVRQVSIPRLQKFKNQYPELLKKDK